MIDTVIRKTLEDKLATEYCETLPYPPNSKEYYGAKEDFKAGFHKADDIFFEFLSGLKNANIWEGNEWKYQRLWREAKKAMEE